MAQTPDEAAIAAYVARQDFDDYPNASVTYFNLIRWHHMEGGQLTSGVRAATDDFLDALDRRDLKTGAPRQFIDRLLSVPSQTVRFQFYRPATRKLMREDQRDFLHTHLIDWLSIETWPLNSTG